jgi:hypothetical protein
MATKILRVGSEGAEVKRWQNFLIGSGQLRGTADGIFGPVTERATKAFQRAAGLASDGIVGPATLGAALSAGFDIGFVDDVDPETNPVLTGSSDLKPANQAARQRMFGRFEFTPDPAPGNPERIRPDPDWEAENIKTVTVPQLKGVPVFGQRSSGRMRFHRRAEAQLIAMWAAWEQAELIERILTYEGSYNPRFIRGSRSTLSNHAFGSAFDINMRWNRLGAVPALEGLEGSVRELVPIANAHGFYWGGHFKTRPDGMHFEVATLL